MDKNTQLTGLHVGEVAMVYTGEHKLIWSHPDHEQIMAPAEHGYRGALRVWVNLGKLGGAEKGFRSGDYVFILTSNGPGPENLYSKTVEHEELTDMAIQWILVSIMEDVTVWGQAAFDEPYLSVVREISSALENRRLSISFSPDCVIHYDEEPVLGYST